MAIYEHNTHHETLWNRGDHQVMIRSPHSDRPMGYCDGHAEDEASLLETAESEGLEQARIERRVLKTGREVWTIVGEIEQLPDEQEEWS